MLAAARPESVRLLHEDRRQARACPPNVEQLIRVTHRALDRCGIRMSPGKVIRLCRDYAHKVAPTGLSFARWIANNIEMTGVQRQSVEDTLMKWIYPDPTGDAAARNVDHVGRG